MHPARRKQCELQALSPTENQRHDDSCIVRFEAIERSSDASNRISVSIDIDLLQ